LRIYPPPTHFADSLDVEAAPDDEGEQDQSDGRHNDGGLHGVSSPSFRPTIILDTRALRHRDQYFKFSDPLLRPLASKTVV
jgi:hypothetical protein